ncbi:hypothetical protein PSEUDO9AG_60218 [Pseudomonas sp. 9Ag]|nr:hypothetical protein PSEUDO9AG_60218 [Pseudomonas sp. 9Ag]
MVSGPDEVSEAAKEEAGSGLIRRLCLSGDVLLLQADRGAHQSVGKHVSG